MIFVAKRFVILTIKQRDRGEKKSIRKYLERKKRVPDDGVINIRACQNLLETMHNSETVR